jgi:hypothetical protein
MAACFSRALARAAMRRDPGFGIASQLQLCRFAQTDHPDFVIAAPHEHRDAQPRPAPTDRDLPSRAVVLALIEPEECGFEIEMDDFGEIQLVLGEIPRLLGFVPRDHWNNVAAESPVANKFM